MSTFDSRLRAKADIRGHVIVALSSLLLLALMLAPVYLLLLVWAVVAP